MKVCQQRNAARDPNERFEFNGYHRLDAGMRRDLSDVGWWFDTSALTPAETAEQLVREAADRALLVPPMLTAPVDGTLAQAREHAHGGGRRPDPVTNGVDPSGDGHAVELIIRGSASSEPFGAPSRRHRQATAYRR